MVFHCFDHDLVLEFGTGNLHSASSADRRVRDVSISGDFVGGVDDYHSFFQVVGEHTRAISRRAVVLPTPGRPSIKIDWPVSTKSRIMPIVPNTARPTLNVKPIISPLRLRRALIRCRVCSMPGWIRRRSCRLDRCNSWGLLWKSVFGKDIQQRMENELLVGGRKSITTSMRLLRCGCCSKGCRIFVWHDF